MLGMLVVALLSMPVVAAAQDPEPPDGAMLIILDASGSMNTLDADGVSFIDKAKAAVLELIEALPDGMQVGLRVYGHREPNTDPVRGCRDTELLVPVGPLDREAIGAAVEGLEASGFTPIGLALTEAAADLPETGPRSIVLVSDGEDTCAPPDPCQIAEDLYGEAFDVRIESVGFLVGTGSAAEQQLRCIAEVSGGGYSTVQDANTLAAQLKEVTAEILEWRPTLTLIGALTRSEAPELPFEPKEDWLTDEPGKIAVGHFASIIMPGETRWYQVNLWHGEWMWIFADLEWPEGADAEGSFEAFVLDATGDQVEVEVGHGEIPLQTGLPGESSPMIGAQVSPDRERPESPEPGAYLVGLRWDAPSEVFLGSLNFSVEVLAGDAESYPRRTAIEGALDPARAPVLELAPTEEHGPGGRGGMFRGPLSAGETRWYRLDVGRGDIVNVFALFPGDRYVGDGTSGRLAIHLTDPDGKQVGTGCGASPQMAESFGQERHQATVGGTISPDADPLLEAVLIGFEWEGPEGQQSEIRFEAEVTFDPVRKEAADALEAEGNRPHDDGAGDDEAGDQGGVSIATTALETPGTTSSPGAGAESADGGGSPLPIFVAIGIVVLTAAVAVPLAIRRAGRK